MSILKVFACVCMHIQSTICCLTCHYEPVLACCIVEMRFANGIVLHFSNLQYIAAIVHAADVVCPGSGMRSQQQVISAVDWPVCCCRPAQYWVP